MLFGHMLLSEKFRKMRKKQEYTHTLNRMGYARLEHKMKTENPTEEVTKVKLWSKAHEKGGKPVNEVVGAILEGLKECNESQHNPPSANSIRDDALARVLGPETRGRVRGLGFGATPSRVNATIQGSAKVKEHEATVLSQSQRLARVEAKLEALLKATQEVISGVVEIVIKCGEIGANWIFRTKRQNSRCGSTVVNAIKRAESMCIRLQ